MTESEDRPAEPDPETGAHLGGAGVGEGFEVVEEIAAYRGVRYAMHRVRERLPDGTIGDRDVVRHPGAAVVIPVRGDGRVILVEQHRTALGATMIEIPAGVLEALGLPPIPHTGLPSTQLQPISQIDPTDPESVYEVE